MSENKFIKKLKGESTTKSVLEIKNQSVNTSFANMPHGTSDANRVYADHSGDAVGVLKSAENWKLNGSTLVYANSVNSDGNDYTGETDKTGGSVVLDGDGMAVSGAGLWVNATYTFTGDPTKTVAIFTAGTKWALKLCGHSLFSDNKTIDFTVLIKIGTSSVISKVFTVTTDSFNFCKDLVIDFAESVQSIIKVLGNQTLTLQLLCSDTSASATIYNGMTVLTSLQRRVDMDAIAGGGYSLDGLETELDNIHSELDGKLNLDGTNTMTGVLKMRASVSFECAIAPYWHGVGFYKLNDDDSVSLMASMEATDGFEPGTNNTYNIGSTSKKWKNLYLAGKAYVSTINNGFDIAVPVTNSADTLALKSEVDNAANSGRMITDQGVWYAKMYAATVAPSAENGTNYADFSQTDGQGNSIIVTYNRVNGAWVQDQTITPPADYDGYVPITSKIWDITEQAGQQGGRILWNHQSKEFTPYPQIVSFEDIEVTGNSTVIMPATPTDDNITNKKYVDDAIAAAPQANTDLSNLTSTGKNIGNWSNNVTNCITEIPQDLKVELNNGTFTLKAGSKAYKPDGTTYSATTDTNLNNVGVSGTDTWVIAMTSNNRIFPRALSNCVSGAGATTTSGYAYDTTTNIISWYSAGGVKQDDVCSFPIAIIHTTNGVPDEITQVFNGFGYIGSTVFALPGVKALAPNGRNTDGTLKNITMTVSTVNTTSAFNSVFFIGNNYIAPASYTNYAEQEQQPTFANGHWYKPSENIMYRVVNSVATAQMYLVKCCRVYTNNNVATGLTPYLPFRMVDYNDFADLKSNTYTKSEVDTIASGKADTNLNNVSAGIDFVIESQLPTAQNNYTWYRKYKSGWVEQGGIVSGTGTETITLPVTMADTNYTALNGGYYSTSAEWQPLSIQKYSTTEIKITKQNSANSSWEVKGMAQG